MQKLAVALVIAFTAACEGNSATKIETVLGHPRDYEGRRVTIAGRVNSSTNLMFVRFFTVSDGTGEITVVTDRAVPQPGEDVRVTGTIEQAFALAGKSVLVFREAAP